MLRSALRARRRAAGEAVAVGLRFGGADVFRPTLVVVAEVVFRPIRVVVADVAGRANCGRSRADTTLVSVLVVVGTAVGTPTPSGGSETRLGASFVVGQRATAASVTAAPAAAARTKARLRRGCRLGARAAVPATPGCVVAARATAVGNCRSRARACSRSSGETSTDSGLIGSAGSNVGSREVGTATVHHCAYAGRRTGVGKLAPEARSLAREP
jgi:hypothetical protein